MRLRPNPTRKGAESLYAALVEQARRPDFYARLDVPDSLDGRFELVILHTFLVLRRLKEAGRAAETGQALVDCFVEDMDANLRELGMGDLGVGRRVKAMVQALYGRIAAYEGGLAGSEGALEAALKRNLFGTAGEPGPSPAVLAALAGYMRRESNAPSLTGPPERPLFGPPPTPGAAALDKGEGR